MTTLKEANPKDAVGRAISTRQRRIDKMGRRMLEIRKRAEDDCTLIERRMAEEQVLLDAPKRGQLTR